MRTTTSGSSTLAACLLSALSQASIANAALYDSVIQTNYGGVQGYPAFNSTPSQNLSNWQAITVWKGIPFAATTGGQNRWKAPQPASAWNGTLDGKDYGNVCPSSSSSPEYTIDEDCLNLNIWSAANSTDAKLPVVMWSYPAYSTAADDLFDGAGMADKGVVYVNYNYRTGTFGWLAHPDLNTERYALNGHNSSGNYGMLDQFAALKWISDNIAAFGGDPEHITVMGQSAGSAATQHIVNSPLTKGLIVGAIIESGVREPHDPLVSSIAENYRTLDFAVTQGVSYLASKNVSTIAQARQLAMSDLIENQFSFGGSDSSTSWTFTATLDYYAMPDTYYNTLVKGLANDVPLITGNTRDESGATWGLNLTVAEYLADLNTSYNATYAQKFLAQYPAGNDSQAAASYNMQWTDRSMVGTWLWARLWRTGGAKSPIYTYMWDHAPPNQTQGAYHESEINYVLNNLYGTDDPWTDEDYEIATAMNDYWVNFIKTGDPNGAGLADWDVTDDNPVTQELGDGWGPMPIATCGQLALFQEWLNTQPVW